MRFINQEGIVSCKALCDGVPTCLSFEYSPTSTQCHRNERATPTNDQYLDYVFCSKQTSESPTLVCPLGYTYNAGDIPGGDAFGRGYMSPQASIDSCKALCDGVPKCMSFEYSAKSTQCYRNEVAAPTSGQYLDYVFCSKQTSGSRGSRTLAPTTTPSAAPTRAPTCVDLSGVYLSPNGTRWKTDTLLQNGCSGTSDGGWSYTVDGATMTIATVPPITGTVTGLNGSYNIVTSTGITYFMYNRTSESPTQLCPLGYTHLEGSIPVDGVRPTIMGLKNGYTNHTAGIYLCKAQCLT